MRYINLKGKPDILLTDNCTEFCNHIFSDYLDNLKIEKRNTRPYNPACNGIVECFNHTIKDLLKREYLKNKQSFNLRLALENCLYYYNNRKHNSTEFTPNYLFNNKNKMDLDLAISNNNKNKKKNIKKTNPLLPKQKVLISNKFVLKKKIK